MFLRRRVQMRFAVVFRIFSDRRWRSPGPCTYGERQTGMSRAERSIHEVQTAERGWMSVVGANRENARKNITLAGEFAGMGLPR